MELTDKNRIELLANMDLSASAQLYESLMAAISQSDTDKITIDAANVERLSTATIQIIISALNNCKSESKELILVGPSEKLRNAFELMGLKEELSKICIVS